MRSKMMLLCAGVLLACLAGGLTIMAQGQGAAAPAPTPPPDTAALRMQYEQWRKDFKTWGRWAPVGQESKGTSALITPEKTAAALKLVKNGIAISLAHAEPQEVAADVGMAGLFHRVTNGIDWNPRPGWDNMRNPIHVAVLNWMGINIVECLDLEQAVQTARRLNRYEFAITFAPLPVEGGTGSPVNPIAIF